MTNEISPAFTNQKPSPVFQQAFGVAPQETLAEGIGASYGVIHYRGKTWSLSYRGSTKPFVRPDDGTPVSYIDVIILRQAHSKSKSYYGKWSPDSPGGERPICASLDSILPDDDVQEKQAESCAICPRNVWKTDANGKKGRECADFKRLAVLLMPAQTKAMLGTPLMEPVFLRIPPASLNELSTFGDRMNSMGWHYSSFITRVSFDPNQSYPRFVFEALKGLTDAEAPVVLPLRDDPQSLRIVGEDKTAAIPGAARIAASVQQAPLQAPVGPPPPAQVETGLLDAASPPPVAPAPLTASPADVGEVLESDAELDAQIKSLLGG